MRKSILYTATLILSSLVILGCGTFESKELTLDMACNLDKVFCGKIQADSRCRNERKKMILTRHYFQTKRDKAFAYEALISTESYVKCAKLAQSIEYIPVSVKFANQDLNRTSPLTKKELKQREDYNKSISKRKSKKIENYLNAAKELKRIEMITEDSSIPELAYYHWTRKGDDEAAARLIKKDEEGKIKVAWLQFEVAQYYASFSEEKSLRALHKSLVLYPEEQYVSKTGRPTDNKYIALNDEGYIHFKIFRHLATTHFSRGNYAASYIYAKILEINHDVTADLDFIVKHIELNKRSDKSKLDDLADDLDDRLSDGEVTLEFLIKLETYTL